MTTHATLTTSQTLTNKTLTSPVIGTITNTGTLTLSTDTDTLALTSNFVLNDTGMLVYLPFDENTGTTAGDKSHYGNDGTFVGAGEPAWSEGYRNTAVDFDGSNDSISGSAISGLGGSVSKTFCIWFYPTLEDTTQILFDTGGTTNGERISIAIGANNKVGAGTAGDDAYSSQEVTFNSWNFVCVTFTSTTITVYLNGVAGTPRTMVETLDTNETTWYIGRRYSAANDFFDGKIDEFRIYARELSTDEIKANYLRN